MVWCDERCAMAFEDVVRVCGYGDETNPIGEL